MKCQRFQNPKIELLFSRITYPKSNRTKFDFKTPNFGKSYFFRNVLSKSWEQIMSSFLITNSKYIFNNEFVHSLVRMTKIICNMKFKSWKVSTERVFLVVARKSRKETNDLCFCSNLLSGDLLVSRDCFHVCVNFNPIE